MTRSFFFIYLGVIFECPGRDFRLWLAIALVIVAVIAAREVSVHLIGWTTRVSGPNRALLAAMLPRGLATAVVAAMLVDRSNPKEPSWETLATFIVVLSNLWMTLRLVRLQRGAASAGIEEVAS